MRVIPTVAVTPDERFAAIPNERVNEALSGWDEPEDLFAMQAHGERNVIDDTA